MSGIIDDQRTDKQDPILWLVATDKALSGWRHGPDKSYVAYPVYHPYSVEYYKLRDWMDSRTDFIRVRLNVNLPRVREGYHLSVNDYPNWLE